MECCYIEVQKGKERHGFLFSFCLRGHCGYIYIIHHDNFFFAGLGELEGKKFYFINSVKGEKDLGKRPSEVGRSESPNVETKKKKASAIAYNRLRRYVRMLKKKIRAYRL